MIGSILRNVGSVVVGLVVALALIVAVEGVSAIVHPFPPGVDPNDLEVCKAHVARYPQWVLALAVVSWGFTAFVSAWLATRLAAGRHPAPGIVVGSLLLSAAATNLFMLPYPTWFIALNLVTIPLATYGGTRLGRGRTPPNAERITEPADSPAD